MKHLLKVFNYDPLTGDLTWAIRPWARSFVTKGDVAGSSQRSGHLIVKYKGKRYYVHRIAWFIMYGGIPPNMIDHIDGDPSNNRIDNLRLTNHRANAGNKKVHREGKLVGVKKYHKRFVAYATIAGRNTYIGSSSTEEGAAALYKEATS